MLRIITLFKKVTSRQSSPTPGPSSQAACEETVQLKRRRLIKGAAATAPVILTLYNGAAFARSSIVVTEATTYDQLFDVDKGISNPLCVTAQELDPIGNGSYHVENGSAEAMDCIQDADGSCQVPTSSEEEADHFSQYEEQCEGNGNGGILIVASSSASLIH